MLAAGGLIFAIRIEIEEAVELDRGAALVCVLQVIVRFVDDQLDVLCLGRIPQYPRIIDRALGDFAQHGTAVRAFARHERCRIKFAITSVTSSHIAADREASPNGPAG